MMGCNCRVTEAVIAVVILVFTFWSSLTASKWIVAIAAVILLIHSMWCKNCCAKDDMPSKSVKRRK